MCITWVAGVLVGRIPTGGKDCRLSLAEGGDGISGTEGGTLTFFLFDGGIKVGGNENGTVSFSRAR